MGKIMLDTSFPNNHAWVLEGGAYALALHLGALAYSDGQGLDGIIPKIVVPHLSLAVPPEQRDTAVNILLVAGFWSEMSRDNFVIQDYERTNFTKAQADAYRDREAAKKRRQRLHTAGDHSLCTSAKWCPVVREKEKLSRGDTKGTGPRDTRGSIPVHTIRPQGSIDMDGNAGGAGAPRPSGPASAGAPAYPPAGKTVYDPARRMPGGNVIRASELGGVDPNTLSMDDLENLMGELGFFDWIETAYPDAMADTTDAAMADADAAN